METLASVSGLSVRYGDVTALDNLTLDILPGEILAVIGPNGSGKTTMAECLEGLRRPAKGGVRKTPTPAAGTCTRAWACSCKACSIRTK